ncbi:MAG: hypothetical protein RLZZ322_265, partial [Verrucomicrobiota bacterium]
GTLTGAIDLADTATASVSGTATGAASLAGTSGLTVSGDLVGALTAGNGSSVVITGTGEATGNATLNNAATLTVQLGGLLTGNLDANNTSVTTVTGTLTGDLDLADTASASVSGTANGSGVLAGDSALTVSATGTLAGASLVAGGTSDITVSGAGKIQGVGLGSNALTLNNSATLTVDNSAGTILGSLTANGNSLTILKGTITGNVAINDTATLTGTGITGSIAGNLTQTGGVVAAGNSPGLLNVTGNYALSGGSLQVEIDGLAGAAVASGHDQVRVAGTITLSGTSVLNFDFANATAYQAQRGAVFQVLANSSGQAKASIGRFDTVLWQDADGRVLFDHSTGRAYGTGLSYGQGGSSFQTFGQYADNPNRLEVARALWMESIDYDNSDLGLSGGVPVVDENFATTANDVAAAQAKRGYKAYILTSGTVADQTATDLGQAALSVLTAADVGEALDALSPEAYAGITDLGIRVARGFAFLPLNQRRMSAVNEWDFSVGYNNDEVESDSTSSYNSYKVRSNQVNVTAACDLSEDARFTLGVGSDEGKVLARSFSADVDSLGLGLGLALTPDTDYRLDLGVAFTTSDWDSTRQGVSAGSDMDTTAFAARLTINTKAQGNFSYKPFAAISYTEASVDSFVEADAPGSVQLGVSGFERKSLLGELGLDFEYKLGAQTSLTGIVSWQHEFQDSGATDMRAEFVEDGVDDTAFSVRSAGFGQDFFRAGLGLRHELDQGSAVSLSVNAILGKDIGSGHQIRADYTVRF